MNIKVAMKSAWHYAGRAWPSIVFFVAVIIGTQILAGALISPDLSARKGFHPLDVFILAITVVLQTWIWLGLARTALDITAERRITIWHLVIPHGLTFRALVVILLVAVCFGLGLLLLIIPGVYLLLSWSQSYWLILDNRARLFDALPYSKRLTQGYKWKLLGAYLLMGMFGILGRVIEKLGAEAIEAGGGGAFAAAFLGSIWSIAYLVMSTFVGVALYLQLRQTFVELQSKTHDSSIGLSTA